MEQTETTLRKLLSVFEAYNKHNKDSKPAPFDWRYWFEVLQLDSESPPRTVIFKLAPHESP